MLIAKCTGYTQSEMSGSWRDFTTFISCDVCVCVCVCALSNNVAQYTITILCTELKSSFININRLLVVTNFTLNKFNNRFTSLQLHYVGHQMSMSDVTKGAERHMLDMLPRVKHLLRNITESTKEVTYSLVFKATECLTNTFYQVYSQLFTV